MRVLCLVEGSTTQNKKIKKKASSTFSVILQHAENTKYRVKYGYLEPFSNKKSKAPHPPIFQKADEKHVLIFTWHKACYALHNGATFTCVTVFQLLKMKCAFCFCTCGSI